MIAIGRIRERPLLVDDPAAGLMGADRDVLDVIGRPARLRELTMQRHRRLDRGL